MFYFCRGTSPACHMCPPSSSVPFTSLSHGSLCYLIHAATHNTLHGTQKAMIPGSSVPFSTFVTFITTFFVRLTSLCMSYPKLSPHLKWKSSLYPSDLRAITSYSWGHSRHVCCSLENLMVVLPFSPWFLT